MQLNKSVIADEKTLSFARAMAMLAEDDPKYVAGVEHFVAEFGAMPQRDRENYATALENEIERDKDSKSNPSKNRPR